MTIARPIVTLDDLFQETTPDHATGCWLWARKAKKGDYGAARFRGRTVLAPRISWMLAHGDIPDGLCVCHRCDVPACVNPDHLFLGTKGDNNRDCRAKERNARGDTHGRRVLSEECIAPIVVTARAGVSRTTLAKWFGVSKMTVGRIVARKIWRHVPVEI